MAADDYRDERHLTEDGWVQGSSWFFNNLQGGEKPRPEGALETWLRHERQSSMYSNPDITWTRIWRNPNADEELIQKLHEKYPKK